MNNQTSSSHVDKQSNYHNNSSIKQTQGYNDQISDQILSPVQTGANQGVSASLMQTHQQKQNRDQVTNLATKSGQNIQGSNSRQPIKGSNIFQQFIAPQSQHSNKISQHISSKEGPGGMYPLADQQDESINKDTSDGLIGSFKNTKTQYETNVPTSGTGIIGSQTKQKTGKQTMAMATGMNMLQIQNQSLSQGQQQTQQIDTKSHMHTDASVEHILDGHKKNTSSFEENALAFYGKEQLSNDQQVSNLLNNSLNQSLLPLQPQTTKRNEKRHYFAKKEVTNIFMKSIQDPNITLRQGKNVVNDQIDKAQLSNSSRLSNNMNKLNQSINKEQANNNKVAIGGNTQNNRMKRPPLAGILSGLSPPLHNSGTSISTAKKSANVNDGGLTILTKTTDISKNQRNEPGSPKNYESITQSVFDDQNKQANNARSGQANITSPLISSSGSTARQAYQKSIFQKNRQKNKIALQMQMQYSLQQQKPPSSLAIEQNFEIQPNTAELQLDPNKSLSTQNSQQIQYQPHQLSQYGQNVLKNNNAHNAQKYSPTQQAGEKDIEKNPFPPQNLQSQIDNNIKNQAKCKLQIRKTQANHLEQLRDREREKNQSINSAQNNDLLCQGNSIQLRDKHDPLRDTSQLSSNRNMTQPSAEKFENQSSTKKKRQLTTLINSDEKHKLETKDGQIIHSQFLHNRTPHYIKEGATQTNHRKFKRQIQDPEESKMNVLGQRIMTTQFTGYDDNFKSIIDKNRTQQVGAGLFQKRNVVQNQIQNTDTQKIFNYPSTSLNLPSMVPSQKTTTVQGGDTNSSQNALNISNQGSFYQTNSNQDSSFLNKKTNKQNEMLEQQNRHGYIRKRKNSLFSNSNISANAIEVINEIRKGNNQKEQIAWEIKFNQSNEKVDSKEMTQQVQPQKLLSQTNRTQNQTMSFKQQQSIVQNTGRSALFQPDRSIMSNNTIIKQNQQSLNQSQVQPSQGNIVEVFGTSLNATTNRENIRNQIKNNKVKIHKISKKQHPIQQYNTQSMNQRKDNTNGRMHTLSPTKIKTNNNGEATAKSNQLNQIQPGQNMISNSGSGAFRRYTTKNKSYLKQQKVSQQQQETGHGQIQGGRKQVSKLNQKQANLINNMTNNKPFKKGGRRLNKINQDTAGGGKSPSAQEYNTQQPQDEHRTLKSEEDITDQRKSSSKLATRFHKHLQQQNPDDQGCESSVECFERDLSFLNQDIDKIGNKNQVFDYTNQKGQQEEFFDHQTSEREFDEYFESSRLESEENEQETSENYSHQQKQMQNTGLISEMMVPSGIAQFEMNPSANPASSFDRTNSKFSRKSKDISIKDLEDQDLQIQWNLKSPQGYGEINIQKQLRDNDQIKQLMQRNIMQIQENMTQQNNQINGQNGNNYNDTIIKRKDISHLEYGPESLSSVEKMEESNQAHSAAIKIQNSKASKIQMQNRWSGYVSTQTQTRFQNIVNANSSIKKKLNLLKNVGFKNESNSLFQQIVEDIQKAAKDENSLTYSEIVNCLKASSMGTASELEPPQTVGSHELQQHNILGQNANLIYNLDQNSEGQLKSYQNDQMDKIQEKSQIKKSKSYASIKRKKIQPVSIEGTAGNYMGNSLHFLPKIIQRKNKSFAYLSSQNNSKQTHENKSDPNQQIQASNIFKFVKTPQITANLAKKGLNNQLQLLNSKESSLKYNNTIGQSLSVRTLNKIRSIHSMQPAKNIFQQKIQKKVSGVENRPQENQQQQIGFFVQSFRSYQSNSNPLDNKLIAKSSERQINTDCKVQNQENTPVQQNNKMGQNNRFQVQNMFLIKGQNTGSGNESKPSKRIIKISRSSIKQREDNQKPNHPHYANRDEKKNHFPFTRNLQEVDSEIQLEKIIRPGEPGYQPNLHGIINSSSAGSSSGGGIIGGQKHIQTQSQRNIRHMSQITQSMNQKRKQMQELNIASQSMKQNLSVPSQKYDNQMIIMSSQQKLSFPSLPISNKNRIEQMQNQPPEIIYQYATSRGNCGEKSISDYNTAGKCKNSSSGNCSNNYTAKYKKTSQVTYAKNIQNVIAASGMPPPGAVGTFLPLQVPAGQGNSITPQTTGTGTGPGNNNTGDTSAQQTTESFERRQPQNRIPQPEIQEFGKIIKWRQGEIIGLGSSSIVYSAIRVDTNNFIAVKKFKVVSDVTGIDKNKLKTIKNEIQKYKQLEHENIVKFFGCELLDQFFCIYLEQMDSSLANILSEYGFFEEDRIQMYTKQILTGLAYLHEQKIKHLDLKCSNILTNTGEIVKLCDFGSAREFKKGSQNGSQSAIGSSFTSLQSQIIGSVQWMAPEVIKEEGCGSKSDIWSLGCTIVEMFVGGNPWGDQLDDQNLFLAQQIITNSDKYPQIPTNIEVTAECQDFLKQCFTRDYKKRPSAQELLQHTWITQDK